MLVLEVADVIRSRLGEPTVTALTHRFAPGGTCLTCGDRFWWRAVERPRLSRRRRDHHAHRLPRRLRGLGVARGRPGGNAVRDVGGGDHQCHAAGAHHLYEAPASHPNPGAGAAGYARPPKPGGCPHPAHRHGRGSQC
jgi:hypothetical protein